jgi:chemotaxis protein methyltransferase CheR
MSRSTQAPIEDAALALLAARIEAEMGLHFTAAKVRQLEGALRQIGAEKGFARQDQCVEWLLAGRWDADKTALCARFLTIGETYFFREPRALDLVCRYARDRLAAGKAGPLRIWSAGCCTGEEPYSIAMALRQQVPQLAPDRVSILATDLNEAFLEFARAGEYRRWSFRRTPAPLQGAHFETIPGGRYRIATALRAQVNFAQLNLALPVYPSPATQTDGMDIIFCRNVLMYFSRSQMKKVIARLRDCLVDGGWLVVNPSEASSELFTGFTPVFYPDAVFFHKSGPGKPAPLAAPKAPHPLPVPLPVPRPEPRLREKAVRPARPALAAAAPRQASAPPAGLEALERAQALVRSGEVAAALQCLRRAGEAEPLAAALHQGAALIALEHGDQALARQSLKRLLYLQPDSALAHYLYALLEHAQGRRESAVRLLESCDALLAAAGEAEPVDGADGWPAVRLRESVKTWLERVR